MKITKPKKGLYLVSRTSGTFGDSGSMPPCEGATKVMVEVIDERNVSRPEDLPTGAHWFSRGSNHRVENGRIKRNMEPQLQWAVKIPDIMQFIDANGQCVLSRDSNGHAVIEIYDDYRE